MIARKQVMRIVATLMLTVIIAAPMPIQAASANTDYTGTIDFLSWVNPVPPVVTPGGTIHEQIVTQWIVNVTDPRLSGIYIMSGQCTWPHEKPWPWGPCHLRWTLDTDNDQRNEWEGNLTVTPQDYRIYWQGTGHGLDEYGDLKVSFKVEGGAAPPANITGRVTGK